MRASGKMLVLVVLASGCGGGDDGTGPGPGPGTGPMTASVNGTAWVAGAQLATVATVAQTPGLYVISGTQASAGTSRAITLTLMSIPGTGTYPLGVGVGVAGGNGIYADPTGGWGTPLSGEAGTITLTTLSSTRIAGTFSFTADQVSGGATGVRNVTNGTFDLPITTAVSTGTVPNSALNKIGATVGGTSYNAATVAVHPAGSILFGFASANHRRGVSLSIQGLAGPGTYALGTQGNVTATIGVSGECAPGGAQNCAWSSAMPGSTGSITVSTIANGRATGTFSGTLARAGATGAATITVAGGTFDIGIP